MVVGVRQVLRVPQVVNSTGESEVVFRVPKRESSLALTNVSSY